MVNISISSEAKEQIQQVLRRWGTIRRVEWDQIFDDPSSGAVDVDTVEWICSETKLIVALAGLKLIEQGKIQLDTPVAQYLPELANPVIIEGYSPDGKAITRPATTAITFQHLLNFTSGLFYNDKAGPVTQLPLAYTHSHKEENPIEFFFKIIQGDLPGVPLLFEPGSNWAYGFSSDCVGFIVERITKQTLEEYCKEHIFGPLGLKSTSFYLTPDLKARLQPLTFRKPDGALTRFTDQYELMEHDYTKGASYHLEYIPSPSWWARLVFDTERISCHPPALASDLGIDRKSAGTAKDPILSVQSVASLFEPSLSDAGAASLSKIFPIPGVQWQWSTGLCVNTNDWDGKRRKDSGFC
ncbi:beta-lactamase/transpeptidase-like protein [Infundibulicybe gibba]|nr:beta-lactamase/transpeptidase-like protein [Infundibulicybe gibba]